MPEYRVPLWRSMVSALKREIAEGVFPPGSRLPSIRELAKAHACSKNTAVSALERLVEEGLLEPKRGSGYFVLPAPPVRSTEDDTGALERAIDTVWLMRQQLQYSPEQLRPSDGFPPVEWLREHRLERYHQRVVRASIGTLFRYGDRCGYPPLRQQIVRRLDLSNIAASSRQILLTHGANDAMDIVARYFLRPGDVALADEPGYYPLYGKLRLAGAKVVGVPRTPAGPDVAALERLILLHRPRLFFTQPTSQNPTGSDITPACAHQVLKLAERHGLHVVEIDPFADLKPASAARIAALDQLDRVVYLGSYSKSLSAALRVGYIAAHADLVDALADVKMLMHVSSSEYCERMVEAALSGGHFSKHVARLRDRLGQAAHDAAAILSGLGAELFCEASASLYAWARFPAAPDAMELTRRMLEHRVVLAPGQVFHLQPAGSTGWCRYNVGQVIDPRFAKAMRAVLGQ